MPKKPALVGAVALLVLLALTAFVRRAELRPWDLPEPQAPSGIASLPGADGREARDLLADQPLPVIPGDPREVERIRGLLGDRDPHQQLWAIETGCWLEEGGEALAREALESADPRERAAGVVLLGCQAEDPVAALLPLLDEDDALATAAAMELARLDARAHADAVLQASERIEDPGLAVLVAWCAYCLGAPVARFDAPGRGL